MNTEKWIICWFNWNHELAKKEPYYGNYSDARAYAAKHLHFSPYWAFDVQLGW